MGTFRFVLSADFKFVDDDCSRAVGNGGTPVQDFYRF